MEQYTLSDLNEAGIDVRGFGEEEISSLLSYANYIAHQGYPVIFDHFHLAQLADVDADWLTNVANGTNSFYRQFHIPKRSGGHRLISAPYPMLLKLQKWVSQEVLSPVALNDCVHGFVQERSILSNASVHLEKKYLLKVDIKDFFPSVHIKRVYRVFQKIGYSDAVCFFLARSCCYKSCLPQGSPASPMLSNIVFKRADKRLEGLAKKFELEYTRYADDLTFSGEYISPRFISLVRQIINHEGFRINEKKLRRIRPNSQKIVTGINVSGATPRVAKSYKRDIRKKIFFLKKYGVLDVLERQEEDNPLYLEQLLGKLNFWLQVEPSNAYALNAVQVVRSQMSEMDKYG